jgi:hypothetical protein
VQLKATGYSPEWDWVEGGSKLLLTFMLAADTDPALFRESLFKATFGDDSNSVMCELVQMGVVRAPSFVLSFAISHK